LLFRYDSISAFSSSGRSRSRARARLHLPPALPHDWGGCWNDLLGGKQHTGNHGGAV